MEKMGLRVRTTLLTGSPRRNNSSFTLLEILLVVVILSVVAGLSLPNFKNTYKKFLLKKNVDDLVYAMRFAQARAVMKNAVIQLRFDEALKKYKLSQREETGDASREASFTELKGKMGQEFFLEKGINVELEGASVDFYPDASIEKKDIKLCDERGCYLISTALQRGFVSVSEEEKEF